MLNTLIFLTLVSWAQDPKVQLIHTNTGILITLATPVPPKAPTQEASASQSTSSTATVEELQKAQEAYSNSIAALNTNNPFTDGGGKKADTQGVPPEQLEQIQKLQAMLENPLLKKYLKLFQDPQFQDAMKSIVESPNKKILIYAEILLVLALLLYRAWKTSFVDTWQAKLWINFYSVIVYFIIGSIALPTLLIGSSYFKVLTGIYRTLVESSEPKNQ